MHLRDWIDRLAPDLLTTLRRFPLASLLILLTTVAVLVVVNEQISLTDEFWWRIVGGLASGAVFAVAGSLFNESRPRTGLAGIVIGYVLPLLAVAAFQVSDANWFVPWALPVISVLWLSVSAFTERGPDRALQQDKFWWLNQQAAVTALIAGVAFLLVALGIAAIERSLSILFGLETSDLFYRWVLPIIGFLFTPIYWLATIRRLDAFDARALQEPDIVATATGFLGQFVLTPLLLAYALILLAYTLQIVLTQSLPEGMLGWMVLGFVTTGAATWLLLHPAFMRERLLVRVFRRWWFWLTVIPLGLYALAVMVRVDAYGLTPERMMLMAGGIWAALLTVIFLIGRGDIRLIPALAGVILLVFSIGPWNMDSLSRASQAASLDALLAREGVTGPDTKPQWSGAEAARATGAMAFLLQSEAGRANLEQVLASHGVTYEAGQRNLDMFDGLGPSDQVNGSTVFLSLARPPTQAVDVGGTPYFLGRQAIYVDVPATSGALTFALSAKVLTIISISPGESVSVDLVGWLKGNTGNELADPVLSFSLGGIAYRYVLDTATVASAPDGGRSLTYLEGTLFADAPGSK